MEKRKQFDMIDQGSANLLVKEPDSTYFRLCEPSRLLKSAIRAEAARGSTQTNGCGNVPIKFWSQNQAAGQNWLTDSSLPTPVME